jgi:hypothetical protein
MFYSEIQNSPDQKYNLADWDSALHLTGICYIDSGSICFDFCIESTKDAMREGPIYPFCTLQITCGEQIHSCKHFYRQTASATHQSPASILFPYTFPAIDHRFASVCTTTGLPDLFLWYLIVFHPNLSV